MTPARATRRPAAARLIHEPYGELIAILAANCPKQQSAAIYDRCGPISSDEEIPSLVATGEYHPLRVTRCRTRGSHQDMMNPSRHNSASNGLGSSRVDQSACAFAVCRPAKTLIHRLQHFVSRETESMADGKWYTEGLQPVEILHVDTENSQVFYRVLGLNSAEKRKCQALLKDSFQQCCQEFNGHVANWQGDGGHAFFDPRVQTGGSVKAAKAFLDRLPTLAQEVANKLGSHLSADQVRRRMRIKAHYGQVFLTDSGDCDSGQSEDFDSFLKHEKELAPIANTLFITDQLRRRLGAADKLAFEEFAAAQTYGELHTPLHRLVGSNSRRSVPTVDEQAPAEIEAQQWRELRQYLARQSLNAVARNSIPENLIELIDAQADGAAFNHNAVTGVTLRALYRYLVSVDPDQKFRISLWRRDPVKNTLVKVDSYPTDPPAVAREISLDNTDFFAVRAFRSKAPQISQSVPAARLRREWVDFDPNKKIPELQSAMQLPITRNKVGPGNFVEKEVLGVLSVDVDAPDFFLQVEAEAWMVDLSGYLVNLALAEHMRQAELRRASVPRRGRRAK